MSNAVEKISPYAALFGDEPQNVIQKAESKQRHIHNRSDLVTEAELADFWGVSTRQVRKLVSDAEIVHVEKGRFSKTDATQAYIQRLVASAKLRGGNDPELRAEKLRIAREQADQLELKNAEKRGEMVPAAAVKAAWAEVLRDVRAAMLAVPSRVLQRLPHLSPHDLDLIDREIRKALQEAATDDAA